MRFGVVLISLLVLALLVAFSAKVIFPSPEITYNIGEFSSWQPTPAEIRKEVGEGTSTPFTDARHIKFAEMFRERFRAHQIGVGVRFLNKTEVKLMCAGTIPQDDMRRVAAVLHDEARDLFGDDYSVLIYRTLATGNQRIGEAHSVRGSSKLAIRFYPPRMK